MSVEFNRKLAYTICERWSIPKGGDVEPFFDLFHDDAEFTTMVNKDMLPRLGGTLTKGEFRHWVFYETRLTASNVNVAGVTADENRVAVEAYSNMEVQGKAYKNSYHWLFEVKDGKISKARFYLDTLFAKQAIEWMDEASYQSRSAAQGK
ncbi:hypothetical protein BKA56DRAFT_603573 [Ilyonectria sp. MPI-CAGE-AT-0026]|nr:hypothetical protein BKA56DRAFT_603573 [Ilyonectria sp. MPI-CAGE-AT-0026]